MRIGITGHSDFLGKGLFDLLGKNHEVIGFSRSNGYDLKNYKNILKAVLPRAAFFIGYLLSKPTIRFARSLTFLFGELNNSSIAV